MPKMLSLLVPQVCSIATLTQQNMLQQAVVAAAEGRRGAERHGGALAQRLRVAEAASASAAQQLAEASEVRT